MITELSVGLCCTEECIAALCTESIHFGMVLQVLLKRLGNCSTLGDKFDILRRVLPYLLKEDGIMRATQDYRINLGITGTSTSPAFNAPNRAQAMA